MYFPAILILPIALKVVADGQFKSRPDLSPPRLNITIPASEDVGEGYIFVAPYSGFIKGQGFDGPEQQAGYILRDNGDLVWSSLGCLSGWVGNMQVSRLNGKPVLSAFEGYLVSFHGHGFGHPIILDQHYTATKQLRGGNHKIISIHEFNVLEESSSALVEVYQPTQMDLFLYGGDNNHTWIVDAIFQELDITTNDVLFEWRSLQHAPPSASMVSLASGHAGDGANSTSAWDYFHINSVDKNYQGDYLISARHASAVYKINGKTGDILWQLGGSRSDFSISDDTIFGFQHDARFFRNSDAGDGVEFISLFDNAARANGHRGGGIEVVHSKSRAKVIRLDTNSWTASLVTSLPSPGDILAPSQGNVQTLPNGNLFVNWGQGGAVTEFRASDGLPIFHAFLDSGEIGEGVQSYRGFRFPWHGYPKEAPALVWRSLSDDQVQLFVSWNGDTEAVAWRFYAVPRRCPRVGAACSRSFLGTATLLGFETSLVVPGLFQLTFKASGFVAEAIDAQGMILVVTEIASLDEQITHEEVEKPGELYQDTKSEEL